MANTEISLGQLLDTASCHQEATLARSDKLFSLQCPGRGILIMLDFLIASSFLPSVPET